MFRVKDYTRLPSYKNVIEVFDPTTQEIKDVVLTNILWDHGDSRCYLTQEFFTYNGRVKNCIIFYRGDADDIFAQPVSFYENGDV